jgi:hypothetical protein
MRLPRWLRHFGAKFLALHEEESGGMMHDYANGQWNELMTWTDDKGQAEALSIVDSIFSGARDAIYIVCIRVGPRRGYFVVYDSNLTYYHRSFWTGIYEPEEAFDDVRAYCRQVADKMGFRRPDEATDNQYPG